MPNPNPSIPYPSRRNDERRREKSNDQIEKFYEIFKDLSFKISLMDALILMMAPMSARALSMPTFPVTQGIGKGYSDQKIPWIS
ncbi:hypothetical protein Tco_1484245 [Tanacetum coccineum]